MRKSKNDKFEKPHAREQQAALVLDIIKVVYSAVEGNEPIPATEAIAVPPLSAIPHLSVVHETEPTENQGINSVYLSALTFTDAVYQSLLLAHLLMG